jgi:hypothetical protein
VNTDELIGRLAGDATPVRPLAPPRARLARWSMAALAVAALGVAAIGARADVLDALARPLFLWTTILMIVAAGLAAAAALVLSIPGVERSPLLRALALAAAAAWPIALLVALAGQGDALARLRGLELHGACGPLIAGLAVVPAWVLFRMVRAGAPLRPAWSAGLATLAATATAATAVQIICTIDAPAHHLIEHVVPVAILCAAGAAMARRWMLAPRCV